MGKADKPEKNKNKKQKNFWKDFKAELKKVIWPTKSQVINNTVIVLIIVAIVTITCFVLDLAFEALNTYGIDKLKTIVQESTSENNNNLIDGDNINNENTVDTNTLENITNNEVNSNETIDEAEGQNVSQ